METLALTNRSGTKCGGGGGGGEREEDENPAPLFFLCCKIDLALHIARVLHQKSARLPSQLLIDHFSEWLLCWWVTEAFATWAWEKSCSRWEDESYLRYERGKRAGKKMNVDNLAGSKAVPAVSWPGSCLAPQHWLNNLSCHFGVQQRGKALRQFIHLFIQITNPAFHLQMSAQDSVQ